MTDFGVATTSSPAYEVHLAGWARRVLALRPKEIFVVLQDGTEGAQELLSGLDIPFSVVPQQENQATARNFAIEGLSTPWVQHFDVDDVVYPNAHEVTAALVQDADVVAWGLNYEDGREHLYSPHVGRLGGHAGFTTPASSGSPFRREFWEEIPFQESLGSFWDAGLWVGFGHLGARFVPTPRPVYLYADENPISITNNRDPEKGKRDAAKVYAMTFDERMFVRGNAA